jgi:hypothetical protein
MENIGSRKAKEMKISRRCRRLPATLPASRHISRGSRLWVAVKRVTQSEVAAMDFALGGGSLGNLASEALGTVGGRCEPDSPLWSVVRFAVLCVNA